MVGVKGTLPYIDIQSITNRLKRSPGLPEFFQDQGDRPIEALLTSFRLQKDEITPYVKGALLNSDDLNRLEFNAPKALYRDYPFELEPELLSLRTSETPNFIRDPGIETTEGHLHLGKYLLQRGRPGQAKWQFERIPPNLVVPPLSKDKRFSEQLKLRLNIGILEDFDSNSTLSFTPLVGSFKPESIDSLENDYWEAYQEYFIKVSGRIRGVGRKKSSALVLNSIDSINSTAFYTHIPVDSLTTYKVDMWIKHEGSQNTQAGAGYSEFDTFLSPEELTLEKAQAHMIGGEKSISLRGPTNWTQHSFLVETSPKTNMILLQLYRFGEYDPGTVFFDDISIIKVSARASN